MASDSSSSPLTKIQKKNHLYTSQNQRNLRPFFFICEASEICEFTCLRLNLPLCMENYELLFPFFDHVVLLPPECLVWRPDHSTAKQDPVRTEKYKEHNL